MRNLPADKHLLAMPEHGNAVAADLDFTVEAMANLRCHGLETRVVGTRHEGLLRVEAT